MAEQIRLIYRVRVVTRDGEVSPPELAMLFETRDHPRLAMFQANAEARGFYSIIEQAELAGDWVEVP